MNIIFLNIPNKCFIFLPKVNFFWKKKKKIENFSMSIEFLSKPAIQLGDTKAENQSHMCGMVCVCVFFSWGQISPILQKYFEKNLGKCVFQCKMCFFPV
jgi:hypothetical protein